MNEYRLEYNDFYTHSTEKTLMMFKLKFSFILAFYFHFHPNIKQQIGENLPSIAVAPPTLGKLGWAG